MKKDETYEYKMLALDPDRPETDKEINKLGKKDLN